MKNSIHYKHLPNHLISKYFFSLTSYKVVKVPKAYSLFVSMYYVYSINNSPDETSLYVGITRDVEFIKYYHETCSASGGQSRLHSFIRDHGGFRNFLIRLVGTHDTYEEAKTKKLFGILNETIPNRVPTIYKIFCLDPNVTEQYIGQTINFDNRMFSHFVSESHVMRLYDFIRSHGGFRNWKMATVKQYPVTTTKQSLDRLEWYWWNKLGGELNSVKPGTHRSKWKGSDEEFEESCSSSSLNLEKFSIREISLDI